ncbi:MAG: IS256 family transposase [Notoacmeibacter sp.]|nr:IS256 family transposase [Notoacmeibacter sp.]MCC0026777.1 IS256 family transposase [Brucellaceae bacterium]
MAIKKDVLDQLLAGRDPAKVFADGGLVDELKKALANRVLNAELDDHLAGEAAAGKSNRRNGYSAKTVISETSRIELKVPRDREGTFDPKLIARYQRRFPGFDGKIISMYARGMSVREIQGHLQEIYGLDVSPDLISTITDAVLETVTEWQNRPLERCYPLIFFDAMRVKIRDEGLVRNKAVYLALGIQSDGTKDILGIWIETSEGAKFWLRVMNELKNRGVEDILIAIVDGLKGFPEAINAAFPATIVQTCVVHLIRHSLDFVSWKDRKPVVPALREIYRATDAEAGMRALLAFEAGPWGHKYPAIAQSWHRNWDRVIPFFAFSEAVRRIIYTTNAIEALNSKLRRAVKIRGHFPNDDAAMKLIFLVLRDVSAQWKMQPREWTEAKTQFAIQFQERFVTE